MSGYKVEICGLNTARLPLLTNEVLAYLGCWVWLTLAIRN